MSEDIGTRQRRYLLSMGIRTACFLAAIFTAGHLPLWVPGILIVGALVLPYVAVVIANAGREPETIGKFEDPQGSAQNEISGRRPEIGQ